MFRMQTNAFDDVIAKATDENLTSENWEYMMDAWEKVNSSGENGPKDAVSSLIKRLAHRNANVQLYTLELANAFTQNCAPKMHQEMASRAFTEALLRLAGDRTTHQAVKSSVLEKMGEWSRMFASDPGLGIMEQAFNKLKSQNPNLHPPSKPHKKEITELDRQKEEEELQMALAISLGDRANASGPSQNSTPQQKAPINGSQTSSASQAPAPQPTVAPHTTAATVSRVRALYDFVPSEAGELAFRKGDIIAVLESVYKDWWKGSLRGQTGIFPLNYVEKLSDPTAEELQRDAQMEAEVFGQIKNVEKLLALLSTSESNSSVQDNEEITTLYHSTLAIRPKLIELIGKYSQKKDDFVALNEKFIKARRDYESLLESSMSQSAAAHYGRPPTAPNPYVYPPTAPAAVPPADPASRYYTSTPHSQSHHSQQLNPSASPPAGHGAYPPPQKSPTTYAAARPVSNQYYETSPSAQAPSAPPFYVVGNTAPGRGRSPSNPPPSTTTATAQQQQQQQHQPQEMPTSTYDTPTSAEGPGGYAPYQSYSNTGRAQRPHSYGYPSPQGQPSYGEPQQQQGGSGPQDYYRQSELFLPSSAQGGRAQS